MKRICVGGAVDPETDVYITRSFVDPVSNVETSLESELCRRLKAGVDTVITGPRQSGKTSLAKYATRTLGLGNTIDTVWVDLNGLTGELETSFRQRLLSQALLLGRVEAESAASPPSWADFFELVLGDTDRPLVVMVDELDKVATLGDEGARFVLGLRSVQQDAKLGRRLTFCFMSVRATALLFRDVPKTQLMESALELYVEPLPVGTFAPTDECRRQLEGCFTEYDPRGAGNLARLVLELSGGWPQLCLALAHRLWATRTPYADKATMDAWFGGELHRFRMESELDDKAHFMSTPGAFLAGLRFETQISALTTYKTLLTDSRQLGAAWEPSDAGQYALVLCGLAIRRDDRVRTLGGLMDRFYDQDWADRSLVRAQQRTLGELRGIGKRARICIILTGGTIGMVERNNRVDTPEVIDQLERDFNIVSADFDVQWLPLTSLDSVDVGPRQWTQISEFIHRQLQLDVDGIVVAHGTDTLAYTASAVAYALGRDLSRPVVFTGSQTTIDQPHGDARSNLYRACLVAAVGRRLPEVVISFDETIFRAVRAMKRDDRRFDAFESFLYPPLGTISEEVELQDRLIRHSPIDPLPRIEATFSKNILVIAQHPAQSAAPFEAALKNPDLAPDGVIIQTLGAGNIPTAAPYDLGGVIGAARDRKIPVLLTSQHPVHVKNFGRYGPSARAIAAGAIPIPNMTAAATITKFSWVLGRTAGQPIEERVLRGLMLKDRIGEIDAPWE